MKQCLLLLFLLISPVSQAIWFEASGQAVVVQGDKQQARQLATQEAIKQALMFAGARVSSVQKLANGLLQDDRFEIRASGEVDRVELINEIYQDDIVTVSIRADIFPQDSQCSAADYRKRLVTSWFPIADKRQATLGEMFDLGKVLPGKLRKAMALSSRHLQLSTIEDFYIKPDLHPGSQAMGLSRKNYGQLVLLAQITDLSHQQDEPGTLTFWRSASIERQFALNAMLIDGMTGELLLNETFHTSAPWPYDLHQSVQPASHQFWQSSYGLAINDLLNNLAQRIDEEVACLPANGRVLQVNNEQLTIDLGQQQGVNRGDKLRLFKLNQFMDQLGNSHYQYFLHPVEVVVTQVQQQYAVVESASGAPLANIQPNDFVSKR
ncbi:flagellar assembly protein FlgT [Bowmanella denitrificans]|uniref:Flagellar assembly protein FlgT n=1 Tax=Bowmanella denitrificans TaxID=366582 RepID=A0ABN0XLC9_9ALTE